MLAEDGQERFLLYRYPRDWTLTLYFEIGRALGIVASRLQRNMSTNSISMYVVDSTIGIFRLIHSFVRIISVVGRYSVRDTGRVSIRLLLKESLLTIVYSCTRRKSYADPIVGELLTWSRTNSTSGRISLNRGPFELCWCLDPQ